jgi:hypothetical protein
LVFTATALKPAADLPRIVTLASHEFAHVRQRVASVGLEVVPGRAEGGQIGEEQRVDSGQLVLAQGFKQAFAQRPV